MDKDRYQKHIFYTSAIIAVAIFTAGLLLGWTLDNFRINSIIYEMKQNELNTESYLIENDFIKSFADTGCSMQRPHIDKLASDLGEIGRELAGYEGKSTFKKEDYEYLTRKYFLMEVRTYTLFKDYTETCGNISTILYFYKINDELSIRQGYAIDEIVRNYKDVYVFSFDIDYDKDPLLDTVKIQYNITKAPSIIVNDKLKHENFAGVETIKGLLRDSK